MVALTAEDLTGTSARVRAKKPDGSWGPWYEAEALEGVGDGSPGPHGTEPVFVGRTTTVQIAVTRPDGAAPTAPTAASRAKPGLGYVPATVEQPFGQNINAVLISPPQAPVDVNLPTPTAADGPRRAAEHHQPRTVGRRRIDAVRRAAVRRRGARRHRPPHRGQQRLRAAGFGRDRQVDLRVPHPHAGLVRHRLQRAGRQVRAGLRGPGRRHGQAGRGRPHRRVQPEHLGRGDDRQLRRRAADPDPAAHHRPAAGLAAGPGPRRPQGHRRADLGGRPVHPLPARRHPDAADDLHPPRRRQHRLPGQRRLRGDGPHPRYRRTLQRSARAGGAGRVAARRRDLRPVGVDGRDDQPARRPDVAGGVGRGVDALRQVRQRRGLLVAGKRRRTRHRGDL